VNFRQKSGPVAAQGNSGTLKVLSNKDKGRSAKGPRSCGNKKKTSGEIPTETCSVSPKVPPK